MNISLTTDKSCIPAKNYGKGDCCIAFKTPPNKPDPAIYCQQEIIRLGAQPTWNNPDIITNHWDPWSLDEVPTATVHNLSTTTPAINVNVGFSYAQFGIGFQKIPLSNQMINLSPGASQTLAFTLPSAIANGFPAISSWINIVHSTDKNPGNNEGCQTIFGAHTNIIGRNPVFTFPVFNSAGVTRTITLITYSNELSAVLSPVTFQLLPFEQKMITLHLTVPSSMHAAPADNVMKEVTIAAFSGGSLIGGLTYIMKIDD